MNKKTVSLIITCFNSEDFLEATLNFALEQYYDNIQIICVNDGSTDGTLSIIQKYVITYKNFKLVDLKEKSGLFSARLAGAAAAEGDYILFLDSNDEITPGWVSALVRKAEANDADLVLGDLKFKNSPKAEDNKTYYYNLEPLHLEDIDTDGSGMLDRIMNVHGLCPHYHAIWNKLIRRDLWQACLDNLNKIHFGKNYNSTGEDAAVSIALCCHARRVCNIHNQYYICISSKLHSTKYTDSSVLTADIKTTDEVFTNIKNILESYGVFTKYCAEYEYYRQRYGFAYLREAKKLKLPRSVYDKITQLFRLDKIKNLKRVQSNFYYLRPTETSSIYGEYTRLLGLIYSKSIKVISFDIFDTLVVRPFGVPRDIFIYLNKPFNELFQTATFVDFSSVRRAAEINCRDVQRAINAGVAESNLNEIYDHIAKVYGFDRKKLERIKQLEMENEVRFSYPRKFAVDLYNLALEEGKRIILASDMYLPRECIIKILDKCEIKGYEELFISNELRLNKNTGRMYPYILERLGKNVRPSEILHIGDRWGSDVKRPRSYGMNAVQLPSTADLFKAENPSIYTGEFFNKIFKVGDRYHDMQWAYDGFTGMRSLCAVVANAVFDFPYVSFNKNSDFNADPKFIGFFALGMHMYSVARWLIENTRGKGYRRINFAARDGYIIKQAYDILAEGEKDVPESGYIRISRKSFAIADIKSLTDMHSIVHKLNFLQQTPDSIFELFQPVMTEESKVKYKIDCEKHAGLSTAKFTERVQFDKFITKFYNEYLLDAHFQEYRLKLKKYFSNQFKENDVLFDVGYSGRVELVLNKMLGFKIRSFYIHTNHDVIVRRNQVADFSNCTFYNYKPPVSGIVREHMMSEMCPSTIGYIQKGEELEPVFDEYDIDYPTQVITRQVQQSAIKFVRNVKDIFGKDALGLACRMEDVSRPFECYLHFSHSFDRQIFANSEFEDDFGEGRACSILDYWDKALERIKDNATIVTVEQIPSAVKRKNRLLRALYFFIFDRQKFKEKLKKNFIKTRNDKK